MSESKSRLDRAAEMAETARRILEADGDTVKGLVDAAVAAARAQWELDECRAESPLKRTVAAAVETLRSACSCRAQTRDEERG